MVSKLRKEMLTNLMETVLESAGAQKSFLILPSQPQIEQESANWLIEAEGSAENDEIVILQSLPINSRKGETTQPRLPASIINHVVETEKTLVLNEAAKQGEFKDDAYIVATQPKSILCMPLIHQDKLSGILYLENNWQCKAFTSEHLKVLEILSVPVAISIENSHLVETKTQELQENNEKLKTTLAELKQTQEKIIAQEKAASLGSLTAAIAHEIKNPLFYVNGFSQASLKLSQKIFNKIEEERPNLKEESIEFLQKNFNLLNQNLEKIDEHGNKADKLVRDMLSYFRGEPGGIRGNSRQPTNINEVLEEAINIAYHGMKAKNTTFNVTLKKNYDSNINLVELARQDIFRALLNILSNACTATHEKKIKLDSTQEGKMFEPTLSISTKSLDNWIEIRIRDNGTGIPEDIKSKIFDPFFTTHPPGKGTGLGLWISQNIIENDHQGDLSVESEENKYTEFIIKFPPKN